MGSQWVEDPFYGNLANNLASSLQAAPGKALDNISKVDEIKWNRKLRAAAEGASGAFAGAVPPAYAPPRPYTAADISDPALLDAPLSRTDRDARTGGDVPLGTFTDPRAQALAEGRRRLAIAGGSASVLKDPSQWAPQSGYAEVAAGGVPQSGLDRARVQFMTTGKFPTAEETKVPNAQNFAIVREDGSETGKGFSSITGGRTALDGTPIRLEPGERIMETGPVGLKVPSPLKDEASARERLAVMSRQIGPDGPTPDQAIQIQQLVDVAYKPERVVEKIGDTEEVLYIQKNPIPPWVISMMGGSAPLPAPTPVTAPTVTAGDLRPSAGAYTAADIANPARLDAPLTVAPTPVPAAATVPPIVNPNADRVVSQRPGSAMTLRKEYADQPEIKSYANAAQTWNSIVESAYTGNKANDLAIVYGFVKMLDEMTGVRDPEVRMVGQTGSWREQFNTLIGQATGAGLDPNMRVNIIKTMQQRMGQFESAAKNKEQFFREQAVNNRLAPSAVIPPLQPLKPFDEAKALAVRGAATAAPRTRVQPSERSGTTTRSPTVERGDRVFGE